MDTVCVVRATLQDQISGVVVERDLNVEGDSASGLIRGLRIGWWDLDVDLLEGDEVEVIGATATRVVLQVELAVGELRADTLRRRRDR